MPFIPKHEIVDSLRGITQSLSSKELEPLYKANNVEQYNIGQRVSEAYLHLYNLNDYVFYDYPISPRQLQNEWMDFRMRENLVPDQYTKIAFGELVKKTLQFFDYIKSIPRAKRQSLTDIPPLNTKEERKNVRLVNKEQINSDIRRLGEMYSEATKQLEDAKKKGDAKEEEIKQLNSIINDYEARILELRKEKEDHENDLKFEQKQEERLTRSFNELNTKSSGLNYEVKVAHIEYFFCIFLMIGVTVCFFIWYISFYKTLLTKNSPIIITSWVSYLPFALPVTAYIAIMWILVVQKNRASKIAVSLSTRLDNSQYLEGLMKLVNRLSWNSEIAQRRINDIVGKMIDSYIRQLESTNVTENRLEKIEKKEQEDVPQQKVYNELKKILPHE